MQMRIFDKRTNMTTEFSLSIVLDKRRIKSDGTYPVKLRVFTPIPRKQKLYATKFNFSEKDFKSIWETSKPRKEYQAKRLQLQAIENKANVVANELAVFNFEDFERLLFNKISAERNINYYYSKTIEKFRAKESISTSNNYRTALKCLLRFHKKPTLNFHDISVSWLEQFEKFCVEVEGKSLTTVSIYLRTLRTIFNDAKADKAISEDIYPFGKRKYQIPAPRNTKKALTRQQLKILFEGKPKTDEQEKAKAFWFFSYLCNGMNFKDILNLKYKNIEGDKLSFVRAKTAKTNRNTKEITVYLNDYTKYVIETYGNIAKSKNDYVFPILASEQTSEDQYKLIKNFISMVNQNFLKYAKANGVNEKISTYWARHSFATMAIQKGASMEYVGEAVGHTNTKTTMGYFAGFEDETKKQLQDSLLDF